MVKKLGWLLLVSFLLSTQSWAQCAMCRATVENNLSAPADDISASLNFGIMYLLAMPYLAMVVIGFLWYKNSKKIAERKDKVASRIRGEVPPVSEG